MLDLGLFVVFFVDDDGFMNVLVFVFVQVFALFLVSRSSCRLKEENLMRFDLKAQVPFWFRCRLREGCLLIALFLMTAQKFSFLDGDIGLKNECFDELLLVKA